MSQKFDPYNINNQKGNLRAREMVRVGETNSDKREEYSCTMERVCVRGSEEAINKD